MPIENGEIKRGTNSAEAVCQFFGVLKRSDGRYHGADLMASGAIHPQSKIKPVEYNKDTVVVTNTTTYSSKTQLNQEMWWDVNYGHSLPVYSSAPEAIRAVVAGTNAPYNRPANWKRMCDFWGYNHNTVYWMEYSTNLASVNMGGVAQLNINGDLTEIFQLHDVKAVSSNVNSWNFGFLMASSFSTTQSSVYFFSLTDSRDGTKQITSVFDGGGKINFSTSNIAVGTYKMYPVITTGLFSQYSFTEIKESNTSSQWIPYPFSNTYTFSVVQSGGQDNVIEKITVADGGYNLQLIDPANLTFRLIDFTIDVYNDSNAAYDVTIKWSIANKVLGSEFNTPSSQQGVTESIPAGGSKSILLATVKNSEDEAYRFNVGETPPVAVINYSLVKDGQPQSDSITIDLDKY